MKFISTTILTVLTLTIGVKPLLAFRMTDSSLGLSISIEKRDGLICSNTWQNVKQACPSDIPTYLKNKYSIGETHICDALDCSDKGSTLPSTIIYTVFNADTGEAHRFKIVKRDDIYTDQDNGSVDLSRGYIKITEQTPTHSETEAAQLLNSAQKDYMLFAQSMRIPPTANGLAEDNNNSSQVFEHYKEKCPTMLSYAYDVGCRASFNKAILNSIKDNTTHHSITAALKLQGVLNATISKTTDADAHKLTKFSITILNDDSSKTVIRVEIIHGAARITLDKEASRTANGKSLKQLEGHRFSHQILGSAKEAEAFAFGGNVGQQCNEAYLRSSAAVKVDSISTPEGIRVIYRVANTFLVYERCSYKN